MQPVSQAWIENQYKSVVSKAHLKLQMFVANTDLYLSGVTTSASGQSPYSDTDIVIAERNIVKPSSFLYMNRILLDGSIQYLTSPAEKTGLVSSYVTEEAGIITATAGMDMTITLPAVTTTRTKQVVLEFDPLYGYGVNFKLNFNDADNTEISVSNNRSDTAVVDLGGNGLVGFSTIKVTVSKWSLAFSRMVLSNVFLGFVKEFNDKDIIEYTSVERVSLTSEELPKQEINFTLDNSNNIFDADPNNTDPSNLYQYLSKRQKIKVFYGYDLDGVEWINGGIYFLNDWNCPQNGITASFGAISRIGFMSQDCALAGANTDLNAYFDDICDIEHVVDEDRFVNNSAMSVTKNYAGISDKTCAEGLQLIAFSSRSVLYNDKLGRVCMATIPSQVNSDYKVSLFNCYEYPEITLGEEVHSIDIGGTITTSTEVTTGNEKKINGYSTDYLVPDSTIANAIGTYYIGVTDKRVHYQCKLRIDPRIDLIDIVPLKSKVGVESNILITGITINYDGAFSGILEGIEWQ